MLRALPIPNTNPQQYAWTYSEDPSTTLLDEVRFLVQDTDPAIPLITDLEIQYLLDVWMPNYDSALMVAAETADGISRKFAGLISISADGVSVQVGDVSAKWELVGKRLRASHRAFQATGGPIDYGNIMVDQEPDQTIEPLNFSIGGHDNPQAGRQVANHYRGPSYSYEDGTWR